MPNGAFRRSFTLAEELVRQGVEVTFLTTLPAGRWPWNVLGTTPIRSTAKPLEDAEHEHRQQGSRQRKFPYYLEHRQGVKIIAVSGVAPMKIRKFGYDPLAVFLRVIVALTQRFDIVHADGHRPAVLLPALIQRWIFGSWFVSEWWDLYGRGGYYDRKKRVWKWTVGSLDNLLEIRTHRTSNRLIVVSEELRARALNMGRPRDHVVKLWGASDVHGIEFTSDPLTYRKKFGLPEKAFILMASGMSAEELEVSRVLLQVMNEMNHAGLDGLQQHSNGDPLDQPGNVLFVNVSNIKPNESKKQSKKVQNKKVRNRKVRNRNERNRNERTYRTEDEDVADWRMLYMREGVYRTVACVDYAEYGALLSCANAFVLLQDDSLKNRSRWPNCVGDFLAAGRPVLCNPVGEIAEFREKWPHAVWPVEKVYDEQSIREVLRDAMAGHRGNGSEFGRIRRSAEKDFLWKRRLKELMQMYDAGV